MTKTKDFQAQVASEVRRVLRGLGVPVRMPVQAPDERSDFIGHGSDAHAVFLGLVAVEEESEEAKDYVTWKGPKTDITYRLEDEIAAVHLVPGVDPEKAIKHVLRQKVMELEAGVPQIPENAPGLWQPVDEYATLLTTR